MRIAAALNLGRPIDAVVKQLRSFVEAGFSSAWGNQIQNYDTLTLFAVIGREVPGIELGTGVVPVYPRHPSVLAQQALTVQVATGNRLALGIGLSHRPVVEHVWGYSFEKPAEYMRAYLSALVPMLEGESVTLTGPPITAISRGPFDLPETTSPPVLLAALGPAMLEIAGQLTSGTVTWMTGTKTVESHIAPSIGRAAEAAGRPAPRVVVFLPVCVTADPDAARELINRSFAIYPTLPSYKAMLDREGASAAADISFVGTEEEVAADVGRLAEAGATELVASVMGDAGERERTLALLRSLAG
ncbi:MAG TPA: TIGR03564 family F420-dependent LLM class oxidoreductase [Acidimicrobiales bacterium]|nr:TIGR03564 family F420-dependent LLM class oxidoreductase [Acidimicrobiales bacterium]